MNKPKYSPPTISLHRLYMEYPILDGGGTATGKDPDEGNIEDGGVPESQSRGEGFGGGSFTPEAWE